MSRIHRAFGTGIARTAAQVDQGLRSFMLGVYNNMVLGLAISAVVALGINMAATTADPSGAVARGIDLSHRVRAASVHESAQVGDRPFALAFIFLFSFRWSACRPLRRG